MISITKLLGGETTDDSLQIPSADPTERAPLVVWNATRTCNLDCVHCATASARRAFKGELTTREVREMIDDLADFHVPALLITGGEPLARPDVLDLAGHATSKGISVSFATNGTLITRSIAAEMKKIGVAWVGISIDGAEANHDRIRGRAGAFRDAIDGIRFCREAGVPVGLRFTMTAETADDLDAIFRVVETEGIARLSIHHLVYSEHGPVGAELDVTPAQTRASMDRVIEQVDAWNREGRNIEVVTTDNNADGPYTYLWLITHDPDRAPCALEVLKGDSGNCSGITLAEIDSFGNVHPDQFMHNHEIGNIREKKFSAIWNDPKDEVVRELRDRRAFLKGRCATCLWISACNGNFRARAEAATGSVWESDPACYLDDTEIAPNFVGGAD
jgi:radical SAM protein with 4Fe4S-binding SPASM domain